MHRQLEKNDETSLQPKEDFCIELNLEDISDEEYAHTQKVWNVFEIKNRGEYHDLYVNSDTLLLANVFESFRNKCLEIYELDPIYFVSAPGLAWQACLKKTEVKLELITDYDMILMIEKGIRGGISQATHRYAKANNKYMKNQDKNNESSYIEYLDANNLYGWAMSQKLTANGFKWVKQKILSKFNEDFIKKMMKIVIQDIVLKQMQSIQKNYLIFIKIYHFYPKEKRLKKSKNLFVAQKTKKNILFT